METPLLRTKFYIPPTRPEIVPRPRLLERLNGGSHRKLTLISAPAGFGKTTLVAEWVSQVRFSISDTSTTLSTGFGLNSPEEKSIQHPQSKIQNPRVAWLSLDESDNDPARFLTYFVVALSRAEGIEATIGEGALNMLQSPQPPPTEDILISLINEVAALPDRIILVLDDYHIIDSSPIDDALTFLLEHLPPQMHLVVATRDDPLLPLARLRARGQLTELRVADLRFTLSEAARFLNQVMGLTLSTEEVAALETRTEGWIAGLQMAALSMQGRTDTASFIQAFTGGHHFVLDYLVEEVLRRQTERVRDFLLRTSILERLSGSLCDAVCSEGTDVNGRKDGGEMLKALERGNLFVVPLDDKRQWYRYHHLFADVLHTRLVEEWPNRVPGLHRRASAWYERNGSSPDAVRHALAAEDFERVADLAELAWPAMESRFQSTTWLDWVKKLPEELIRARPVLSTQYAWALWLGGELEASEARLRDAERWLDPTGDMSVRPEGSSGGMVVVDKERFRTLPASIALTRAYNAQSQGDVSSVVKYAELALKLTPDEDHLGRANATVTLGLACWASGDLEAAQRAIADWIDSTRETGDIVSTVACTFGVADIMVARGRLHEAVRAYKRSLRLASEHDKNVQRVIAHSHLGLAMLYHEMGDQEAAAQRLLKSEELGQRSTLPDWPSRWCLAQAQLKEAGGDLEAALDLLDEAKRVYVRVAVPDIRPIEALKARVYVRQGRLPKALAWARERGLSVDDELSYLGEFEHIILARVLIAEYKSDRAERSVLQAIGLLERLLKAAEEGRRMGSVIDILALRALAHQARDDIPLALAALERALTLAEPEGYVRIFVDEGPPMEALLKKMRLEDGRMRKYVYKLLAAFSDKESPPPSPSPQPLIDPLSKRECEVLKLLTTELSGPEIAKELMVSMNTIRTHTKNIYSKLGVNSRRDAVRQAKELKLR